MKRFVAVLGLFALVLFVFTPVFAQPPKKECNYDGVCQGFETSECDDCNPDPEPPPPETTSWQVEIPYHEYPLDDPVNLYGESPNYTSDTTGKAEVAIYDNIPEVVYVGFRDSFWNDPDLNLLELIIATDSSGHRAYVIDQDAGDPILNLGPDLDLPQNPDPDDPYYGYYNPGAPTCVFPSLTSSSVMQDCMAEFMRVQPISEEYRFHLQYRTSTDILDDEAEARDTAELHFAIDYVGGYEKKVEPFHSIKCFCPAELNRISPTTTTETVWVMEPVLVEGELVHGLKCAEYYREKIRNEVKIRVSQYAASVEPFNFKVIWRRKIN
jgi:hypothetical protein